MKKFILIVLCISLCTTAAAVPEVGPGVPDLTKGGELERVNKRWVGPLGIHCGSWRPRGRSDEQKYVKQLLVLEVDAGSPADGVIEVGDVILGADGSGAEEVPLFESNAWATIPIAEAITEAEARKPALLRLLIWRPDQEAKAAGVQGKGKTQTITIVLESLGRYSATAPYNCAKSKRVLRKGIAALYEENKFDSSGYGLLCLLAADDPTDPNNDKYQARAKEWAHQLEPGGNPWYSGAKLLALAEYYTKTKDEAIFPKLVAQAEHHAKGVSWFGTTGHRWSEKQPDGSDNGRIAGYGPITCSGVIGFLGISLAREAGVDSAIVDRAHETQSIFFGHYAFRSGMGYGEHAYGIGDSPGDNNGKAAMTALALGLDPSKVEEAKYFTRKAAMGTYSIRQYAHGGSYFGQVWHPIAALQGGVKSANLQFEEVRWHMDLKRRWDHTRIYDSSGNPYTDFHTSATALIFYAAPLKNLYITGRGQDPSLRFSEQEFDDILKTKRFNAKSATIEQLVAALSQGQGMLRGAAGGELASRMNATPDDPQWPGLIDQLLAIASDDKKESIKRAGACFALMKIKERPKGAVASMKNTEIAQAMVDLLKDSDSYIRFAGVRVMQKMKPDAIRPHVDAIMDAIIATDRPTFPLDEADPLQWAHGEMGELLFNRVLNKSLEGVDREKLIPAIRSLLETPNGGARGSMSGVLAMLNREETLAVADLLVDNIRVAPPGNAMGGKRALVNSQALLAKHMYEEALPLSITYGPAEAIKNKIPQQYSSSVMKMESAREFLEGLGDQVLVQAVNAQSIVDSLQEAGPPKRLYKLKRIDGVSASDTALKLPAAQTELTVDATNFGRRGDNETTYTWRKVYGAGKVDFEPNSSSQSKTTKVIFTDMKPGKYRFEVEMSDTLGLNTVRETVDVTLLGRDGKLPTNRPPVAKSQALSAVPGMPLPVTLTGVDPDGDDLGFKVTEPPVHGTLSGQGGQLSYTANLGYNGKDRFTFKTLDGQGEAATGSIEIDVSSKDVGVVVYEGFNYPAGALLDRDGGTSFGFDGAWTNERKTNEWYMVEAVSLGYEGLPTTGNKLVKGKGWWSCTRQLDVDALNSHKLLEDGQDLWFSMIIQGAGQRTRFHSGLSGGETKLGFLINGYRMYAALDGKQVGTTRTGWSRSEPLRFQEGKPHMIIGHCVWGKTPEDKDMLKIYRVFDAPLVGPMVLGKPVCVMEQVVDQKQFDTFFMNDTAGGVDEIRIGTSLHSVLMGTKQLPDKPQ